MPTPSDRAQWFAAEVHPHDAHLRAYLRGTFPSVRDVEDVMQESYLRVWRARAAQPVRSAKAFLFTVARRVALDLLRRERRSPFLPVKEVNSLFVYDCAPDGRTTAGHAMETQLLVEAIDALPTRCREVFVLCHVDGLAQREVAARLGISENTVAVQSARGLQRCDQFVKQRLRTP